MSRKISHAGVIRLGIVRQLHTGLGLSVAAALACADALLSADGGVTVGAVSVTLDRTAIERLVDVRLADALETAPAPQRGRPQKRART